jgi:4-diphosphocytidyl-2-C-methyl-D-erythritol kinase
MISAVPASTILCPAKVNLGLLVSPPGPEGYHDLCTVFQTIGIYDHLEIEVAGVRRPSAAGSAARECPAGIELECAVPELATPDNLVVRAAEAVVNELKRKAAVRLRLRKGIPLGAGLGGGSSDAAGVLRALPPLLGRPLPLSRLLEMGARLGADVPFFLIGGQVAGLGRGATLFPLPDPPPRPLVVVYPGIQVATREAYRKLDESRAARAGKRALTLTTRAPDRMMFYFCASLFRRRGDRLVNDFEPVVFSAYPQLARLKGVLIRAGASPALLSGSGSAVFGMFASGAAAREAAGRIRARWPDWRVWVSRTLPRPGGWSDCFRDEQPPKDL